MDSVCFGYTSAFEIAKETSRILRYNQRAFIAIWALLICPVSAFHLPNLFVDHSLVKTVTTQLLVIAKTSGLPLNPFVTQSCAKFSESVISTIVCFPGYITLSLISKAAVVYSVECTYSRKKFDSSKFYAILKTTWRRIMSTYLSICAMNVTCITLFLMLLVGVTSLFCTLRFSDSSIAYTAIVVGLLLVVFLGYTIIVCDLSLVISVLEDVSGVWALLRSNVLIQSQSRSRVGLIIFVGSTIGMLIVKGVIEYWVKRLSYGDGFWKVWVEVVLVLMYSFVVLIDFMMSVVFYITCKSYNHKLGESSVQCKPVLETIIVSIASLEDCVAIDSSYPKGKFCQRVCDLAAGSVVDR